MRTSLIAKLVLIPSFILALEAPWAHADKAPRLDPVIVREADAYVTAVLRGDAGAVTQHFREDGVVMPDCAPRAAGRAAVEGFYRHLFQGPGRMTAFSLEHWETRVEGDVAWDVGASRQTIDRGPGAPPLVLASKYVVLLKKTGGEWKVAYLIFNADAPAPGVG